MSVNKFTRFYILALLSICALVFFKFLALDALIHNQSDDASIINMSGKQRMLSQRAALFTLDLVNNGSTPREQNIRSELINIASKIENAHSMLMEEEFSENVNDVYFGSYALDKNIRIYVDHIKNLASSDSADITLNNDHVVYILERGPNEILALLDEAVKRHEQESTDSVKQMRNIQIAAMFIIVLVLVLEGIFVLRPIVRGVKKSAKELKAAKEEAEKIAQFPINNPNPLIQIAFDGDIIYANPSAYTQYLGLEEQGFEHPVLRGLSDFIEDQNLESDEKNIFTREITYGDIIYHQTISSVVTNHRLAFMVYCYDITDVKKTQEKARLLEAAIVNAKDGVIITDANLERPGPEILYVNTAFTRMTGYEPEEVIGKSPRMLQADDTDKRILEELRATLQSGKAFTGELKNYTKDGIAYWIDISIVPVKNEDGEITHFAAIQRDITSRKAFETELTINREAAEVASRAKGDFLANMSHELRTPMNGIIGLSDLLKDMNLMPEQLELAEAISSSSRNLLILLNDILDLSKIEANELTLEHVPFDLRRAVDQTIDLLKPIASRKGVSLESAINPIVPEWIYGDPIRLQQIMNNLISNAIKFTEQGYVRLDITSIKDGAGDPVLHMRVEDSGIGIPQEKQESVFNKFTQADVSTARKYGGTGLGLSITKQLVEMMGGEIRLDSVESKGTTFYVDIPVEQASSQDQRNDKKDGGYAFNTDSKILVVDDHPVNLLFMRKVLKKLGFADVDEGRSGREALNYFKTGDYDLIFMDCQMPEMDGFEASEHIRDMEGDSIGAIPIIAVTADAMKGARERCIDAGMNDYISKPIDVEKLTHILSRWLPSNKHEGTVADGLDDDNARQERAGLNIEPGDDIPIDLEHFMFMFEDCDKAEIKEMADLFIEQAELSLIALLEHCLDGEQEEWRKAAHKLKGSAANMGAKDLSSVCLEAEQKMHESRDYKQALHGRIKNELERLMAFLEKQIL